MNSQIHDEILATLPTDTLPTQAKASRSHRHPKQFVYVPLQSTAPTLVCMTNSTFSEAVFRLPPSLFFLTSVKVMEGALSTLPRTKIVALARKAKGSLQSDLSAVETVRQWREDWD